MPSSSQEDVCVIDLSQGDAAQELVQAFSSLGFATVINHGISLATIDQAFEQSKSFFSLESSVKQKYKYRNHASNRGYISMGQETHEQATAGADYKETFDIGKEKEAGMETPWPMELTEFRPNVLQYFSQFNELHLRLLRLVATGLRLSDPDFFVNQCNEQHCNMRLLHYPEIQRKASESDTLLERGALHTDFGTLTLLTQDQVGGLRVQRRDGSWIFLKPVEGGIVLNVGDMLQRWTNDVLRATPHQVVEHPNHSKQVVPERYSIAFFCNANKRVMLEPLSEVSEEAPKYPPINAMEYLTKRLSDTIQK